ncbi:helix-turn-helix domain-containing protein [Tissierella carlieri]|uniref:Helix-turn-helix domain-containing protein n=1 Tax=Tissierella carlieri TaxID=689904 RepID=A0ABT1SEP0_9FIRM|nr:helix-turn-helix transcriptional regulator [Tissierella carlieri]MCQ4924950.1 helix-turn-helix domain-containing protein [Tissierella carlieri]
MSDFNIQFGQRVKLLRKELRMTQEEFSMKINNITSRANLAKIEAGSVVPSVNFAKAVIDGFNISPQWLFNTTNEKMMNEEEKYILFLFRKLNESNKHSAKSYLEYLANNEK